MNTKKVLFFDTWTIGIQNFVPLARELNKLGIENLLVHRGSVDAEPGRPQEEIIKGVLCRDVSYYKTRYIHKILEREMPKVIVMLTSFYILDRAVILSARALGIKTVFLMPGIREVDESYISTTEYETKFKKLNKLGVMLDKLPKYFMYVIPNYLYSGLKYSNLFLFSSEPWKVLWELFMQPGRKILYPTPSHEIHCDKALVYANRYKQFFHEKYGYPLDKIEVTGNPSLDPVAQLKRDNGVEETRESFLNEYGIAVDKPVVTYLASPFVEIGYKGWTSENRVEQLKMFHRCCDQSGFHLVIKLHPATKDPAIFKLADEIAGITVISYIELSKLIYFSSAVIGHHSSTLLIPIVLNKPLFIPRWGLMEYLNDRFSDKDVAYPVDTPNDLVGYLNRVRMESLGVKNSDNKTQYMEDYVTFMDGNALKRIINVLQSYVVS